MTNLCRSLLAWVLLATTTGASHAIIITDVNSYGVGPSGQLVTNGTSFTDSWSLLPYGYTPGTHTITSAHVSFTLFDNNSSNFYSFALNSVALGSGSNFTGTFTFGQAIFGVSLVNLSSTGILAYTITNTSNASVRASGPQFRLGSATLTAQVDQVVAVSVPEYGATAPLLGIGTIAIAFLRGRISTRRPSRCALV